ncbi:MAG: hypothetical protein PHI97_28390 [Desulfobulbus sp.]|nr:hypothetical protein [Desulfobulbus sp.]
MQFPEISHVFKLTSANGIKCDCCDSILNGLDDFSGAINHLISNHSYKILHIGQQTEKTDMGETMQLTVAILGK